MNDVEFKVMIDSLQRKIDDQARQIKEVRKFLDMLYIDQGCSKLFRTELVKVRCILCSMHYDCSVVESNDECLLVEQIKTTGDE